MNSLRRTELSAIPDFPLFAGIASEQREKLLALSRVLRIQKNVQVFAEGSEAKAFFILVDEASVNSARLGSPQFFLRLNPQVSGQMAPNHCTPNKRSRCEYHLPADDRHLRAISYRQP